MSDGVVECTVLESSNEKYKGEKITFAYIDEEEVILHFEKGTKIKLYDNKQECCEARYIASDDNIQDLVGSTLLKIEVKECCDCDGGKYKIKYKDEDDCMEICFVEIITTNGVFQFRNYNEHNGYYGGFELVVKEIL